MRICVGKREGDTYFFFLRLSYRAANSRTMSTEEPEEPATRPELMALIDAAVARALSSRPREPEGGGECLFLAFLRFVVVGMGIRALGEGKGYGAIDKWTPGIGTGGRMASRHG